jgi:NTE family protein
MASDKIENVLILQGGGSLGAFACGVLKSLVTKGIKIDIVAGTSIGGVDAAIIAGSVDHNHPERMLEEFWLELANNSVDLTSPLMHSIVRESALLSGFKGHIPKEDQINAILNTISSITFGNDKFFIPRWRPDYAFKDPQYFTPLSWTYIYDNSPLLKTLEKYIDYTRLQPHGNPYARLIITAVNILTAESLTFDSANQQITPKHILATSGYPSYNFPWTELEGGIFTWDGGLLSNTPFAEVIDASPVTDKRLFFVENYPRRIEKLPENLHEVYHRTRDIMFCDKSKSSIKMSRIITRYLKYIEELYQTIENNLDVSKIDKRRLESIRRTYKKMKHERGAEIKHIFRITRDERVPRLYENTDFSISTIRDSIKDGESKTNEVLDKMKIN